MKLLSTALILCLALYATAQRLPVGIRLNTGIDMVIYDAKTRHYFNNTSSSSFSSAINYQNFFCLTIFSNPYSWSKDSITLNDVHHPASEQLSMEFWSWSLGYSILLPRQRLSVDPYIGIHKTFIENHNQKVNYGSQFGSCGGFYICYYTKPVLKDKFQWYWYLHNQFSFPQLYKLNNDLGKFQYSVGLGFGIRWGSMKDYWPRWH